jgi:serine/threonine protein kinase
MSEVWVDPERPDLVCKRIRSDQATNPVFVHQSRVEAEALRRIDHPAVLRLRAETVEGLWLERGEPLPGPPPEPTRALVDLAAALRAVHAAGVLHRDVKAENLLRVPRGIVLGDFGCARIDGWDDPAPMLGSPEAMSPERLAGAPATAADDWWALGVLAWTWLTGAPPFPSRRFPEVRASVARGLPSWRSGAPGAEQWEVTVRRWLSSEPAARAEVEPRAPA